MYKYFNFFLFGFFFKKKKSIIESSKIENSLLLVGNGGIKNGNSKTREERKWEAEREGR